MTIHYLSGPCVFYNIQWIESLIRSIVKLNPFRYKPSPLNQPTILHPLRPPPLVPQGKVLRIYVQLGAQSSLFAVVRLPRKDSSRLYHLALKLTVSYVTAPATKERRRPPGQRQAELIQLLWGMY